MDYLIVRKLGQGVVTTTQQELEKIGPTANIRLHGDNVGGVEEIVGRTLDSAQGKPISLLIDLGDIAVDRYSAALLNVLSTRMIGGVELPTGSNVVLVVDEHAFAEVSSAVLARTIVLNLAKAASMPSSESAGNPESLDKIRDHIKNAIRDLAMEVLLERRTKGGSESALESPSLG